MSAATLACAAAALVVAVPFLALSSLAGPTTAGCTEPKPSSSVHQASATTDIPSTYFALYRAAGRAYGISWQILAAVGYVESRHGRGTDPGIRSGRNHAGAMGPMQFLADSWRTFGVDGNHDRRRIVYDPADAIPSAANYLRHHGAPTNMKTALFAYNHSTSYVALVLQQAARYGTIAQPPDRRCPPATSNTDPSPAATTSRTAAKIITFARAQLGKPYVWGAEGPDAYDCSGLTQRAYRAAGITLPRTTFDQWRTGKRVSKSQEQPGDLVFFNSGPGSSADNPGHVGIVIGNARMIAAPRPGTVVQIQRYRQRQDLVGFTRAPSQPNN
ncbi:NlpC/P60 family protein [Actinomadura sp. 6N118]|uniref:C40 family peptidase n=1 Tax=Actinomadura sp. 6N118 TaxID=3375151 RepID=UPI0037B62287